MAFLTSLSVADHCLRKRTVLRSTCCRVCNSSFPRSTNTTMCASEISKPEESQKQPQTHVDSKFSLQALQDAIKFSSGDICTVAKTCADGVVDGFIQCYSPEDTTCVFVVCGPGFNGLVGFYTAMLLKKHNLEPSVYAVQESRYIDYKEGCKENNIDLYDFIPSTLDYNFDVVIDALIGIGFDGGDIRPRMWAVYEMLVSTRLAVVSVDVPSGWDLKNGPRRIDYTADTFVKPEVLISLGAPKECSKMFAGGFHFIAGRHLPQEYFTERDIRVPLFPGDDANSVLFSSNPFRHQGDNGERYGKPGQYNATLYTKNPKRTWVDIDDDPDLWDELE